MTTATISPAATPRRVMGLYDEPLWRHIQSRAMCLQQCSACGEWRYPPGPVCSVCLSGDAQWNPISGKGRILSWTIFHRQYLPVYPAPYNVVAVRLDEGPVVVSNLEGDGPPGGWIGSSVQLVYSTMSDGVVLPRFVPGDTTVEKEHP